MFNVARALVSIVLVHGGFADGAGWEEVHHFLQTGEYGVNEAQSPIRPLAEDMAFTTRAIEAQQGPVSLVGHPPFDVITGVGTHRKASTPVYITAFAPDW